MIRTIVTMVVTAIAGLVGYLVSDTYRERQAQKQRDKIASEVARGDEPAVNARIGRFRAVAPWVVLALLIIGGWRGSIAHRSLMGTIVNGQSRAILPSAFLAFQFIAVFLPLTLGSKEASDVSLLFAIRSLRRACTLWSVVRGAI